MKKVLVFSGGLDSSILLSSELSQKHSIHPMHFNYGSKHNNREFDAAVLIAEKLGAFLPIQIQLPFINCLFKSDLLKSGGEIPEGHYADDSMKSTVVPFRNGIMLSIAAGYAESIEAETVLIANHSGDHPIYPDCRKSFIRGMNTAVLEGTDYKVRIESPFVDIDKTEIVKIGSSLGVPMHLSYSCYKGERIHCGVCGTCVERKEAFVEAGIEDLTQYEV